MKKVLAILLLTLSLSAYAHSERDTLGVGTQVLFEENLGQWDARVRLQAQLHNAALFLENDGLTVVLRTPIPHPAPYSRRKAAYHAYKMHFVGANTSPVGEAMQPGYSNYYLGSDPSRWRSHVRQYAVARYTDLYPGIDMELYSASGAMKYNFIVHPGADASEIVLEYEGTDGVSVNGKGNMIVRNTVRDIVEMKPYAFQTRQDGKETEVTSRWQVSRSKVGYRVSIALGDYDHTRDLIIDPVLIFSTYTGSTADNWGTTGAYDSHKNTYTAGLVFGIGYPVSLGAYDTTFNGGVDIGIFKFDTLGTQRLFATYLGGTSVDMPHSMYVNRLDELLIFGTTGSTDFPTTPGAYQTTHAGGTLVDYESADLRFAHGSDIFVSRFNSDGTVLQASTLVGGSGNDGLNYWQHFNNIGGTVMGGNDSLYYNYGDGARGEIVTDNLGNVYVGSTTMSTDFPTSSQAIQTTHSAGQDGIAFKLDYNLRNMLWSTYLGGTYNDAVYSIDVDDEYNLLACGGTSSRNFPTTPSALQTSYGGGTADGFVCKISADGTQMLASTYIGSAAYDQIYFVRNGSGNEVFLFGQTKATGNTMIYNAGYSVYGSGMLLMRLLPDLSARRWSTVFGTSGRINLSPTAFTADICNRVYAAGWGRDFVNYNGVTWRTAGTTGMETTPDAYCDTTDVQDFYIISLDADANSLEYATFFGEPHIFSSSNRYGGGDHVDGGTSRFDRLATLYQSVCASCSHTQGFPTTAGAWSDTNRSNNCNNAVFRFNVTNDFPVAEFTPPAVGCAPYTLTFNNTGRGTAFVWDFGDGTTSTQRNPSHTYATPGDYTVTLVAMLPGGCSVTDTQQHTIQVLASGGRMHPRLKSCGNNPIQIGPQPTFGATYFWTQGDVSDPTVANPWVTGTGIYILQTTAAGCTQTDTFNVQNYNLVVRSAYLPPSCHDSADAHYRLSFGNNINADSLTFAISPAAPYSLTDSTITFDSISPLSLYHITVAGYGCTWESDLEPANTPVPYYQKETSPALCSDSCEGWLRIRYDYPSGQSRPLHDTLITALCPGEHITYLTAQGCPIVDTSTILRNHTLDSLHIWADTDHIYLGESVMLHASCGGNRQPDQYLWAPASQLDQPSIADPLAIPTDTLVCYTLTATSGVCSLTDTLCIHCTEVVCGPPLFTIPNAFTPNADGINDALCFATEGIVEFSICIFNRWGERVYESSDPSQCWDGTYRGHPCLPGVYTYTCHIRCHANEENEFKGDITLIR